jgi:hypothetical protein
VAETDNASNTSTPAPAPLTEGYQAIKGYQPTHLERGYQATVAVTPSLPPQGGSVIAAPGQATGTAPQGAVAPPPAGTAPQGAAAPPPPITPPQGGSVITPSAPVAEQK